MRPLEASVICFMLSAASASAQDCGPFLWLCQRPAGVQAQPNLPNERPDPRAWDAAVEQQSGDSYSRGGAPFPFIGQRSAGIDPRFMRQAISYPSAETPGTLIVDPQNHFLYFIEGGSRAIRYGIGVGKQGFGWSGVAAVHNKQEWPDWHPPQEMLERQPYLPRMMAGGPGNPLGARALYLGSSLYRIHGTNEPHTIGQNVSSGCIRMINQDVIHLYDRGEVQGRLWITMEYVAGPTLSSAIRERGPMTPKGAADLGAQLADTRTLVEIALRGRQEHHREEEEGRRQSHPAPRGQREPTAAGRRGGTGTRSSGRPPAGLAAGRAGTVAAPRGPGGPCGATARPTTHAVSP